MRTVSGILDTIDNAIADHELSADAMRWTPDTPTQRPAPSLRGVEELAEALEFPLTEGQQRMLDHQARLSADFGRVRIHMRAVADLIGEAMEGIGAALRPILDERGWGKPRRPARVTKMRRDYRAKRGRRR